MPGLKNPFANAARSFPFSPATTPTVSDASIAGSSHSRPRLPSGSRKRTRSNLPLNEDGSVDDGFAHRAKRRRSLPEAIINTCCKVLVYTAASGVTFYRIITKGGKTSASEPQLLPPPPPYRQCEWRPLDEQDPTQEQEAPRLIGEYEYPYPPEGEADADGTPQCGDGTGARHNRARQIAAQKRALRKVERKRRGALLHLQQQHQYLRPNEVAEAAGPFASFPPTQPEFNFESDSGNLEVDEKMESFSSKLSQLITEGKKALGRQVVVMSEAKEDEMDNDMPGVWQEEEEEDGDRNSDGRRGHQRSPDTLSSALGGPSSLSRSSSRAKKPIATHPTHRRGSSLGGSGANFPPSKLPVPMSPSSSQGSGYPHRQGYRPQEHSRPATSSGYYSNGTRPGGELHTPSRTQPSCRAEHVVPMSESWQTNSASSLGMARMAAGMGGLEIQTPMASADSSFAASVMEDESAWESPEMRDLMEKARAKVKAMRGGSGGRGF